MLAPQITRVASARPLNSLDLAKAPADTRVVVAMSGGVDSSVVAALLARDGRETPIDDSGAPIIGDDGAIVGVVLAVAFRLFRSSSARQAG